MVITTRNESHLKDYFKIENHEKMPFLKIIIIKINKICIYVINENNKEVLF